MTEIEEIEITRYQKEILDDLRHMLKKYCRIMEWEVPDVDENAARKLIFQALQDALGEIKSEI